MLNFFKDNTTKKTKITTIVTLLINILYSVGNFALGFAQSSFWFATMGAYFLVLSIMRLVCIKRFSNQSDGRSTKKFVGIMLIFLFLVLIGSIILSHQLDVILPFHQIIMISIATYTTLKISVAIINIVKAHKSKNDNAIALRNVSLADATVSILSMQRSMLVTFGDMSTTTIKLFNLITGSSVCVFIFLLGLFLIIKSKNN